MIAATGLTHQLGPNGTAIEGPWDEVMDCVRACHAELHGMGAPRLYTTLKLNTRTDRHHAEVNTDPHQPAIALDRLKQLGG